MIDECSAQSSLEHASDTCCSPKLESKVDLESVCCEELEQASLTQFTQSLATYQDLIRITVLSYVLFDDLNSYQSETSTSFYANAPPLAYDRAPSFKLNCSYRC